MTGEAAGIASMTDTPPRENTQTADASLLSLVERARAGESAAFEELMFCTQHRVAATAWRMLGNREDARDAAQEVFFRTYKYLKSYRPEQDFHAWLYRITVNVCRDMLRRARREPEQSFASLHTEAGNERATPDCYASDADTEEAATLAQQRAIIKRALATLPEKERTAIVLRDLEGCSTEEVARLMNTRPATVRSQVSTARSKIKIYCERFLRARRG